MNNNIQNSFVFPHNRAIEGTYLLGGQDGAVGGCADPLLPLLLIIPAVASGAGLQEPLEDEDAPATPAVLDELLPLLLPPTTQEVLVILRSLHGGCWGDTALALILLLRGVSIILLLEETMPELLPDWLEALQLLPHFLSIDDVEVLADEDPDWLLLLLLCDWLKLDGGKILNLKKIWH